MTSPIELHVHLGGSVRPRTLLPLARRNGVSLPADTEADAARGYEGIFSPAEHVEAASQQ